MNPPNLCIAIAAPGGYALDRAQFERGIARLQAQGITVHNYYDPDRVHQRFAATDAERLAQLNAAAQDPDAQVVVMLRGSYGMTRLLPDIDFRAMADSGKLFVGYSDITAFHMGLYAATGAMSFAGPMILDDFVRDEPVPYTLDQLWDCLRGPVHTVRGAAQGNPAVDVQGTLWGGNLAMLASLIGTPYFARIDHGILFIEDISEHPYRIERMLLQLQQAGVLEKQKALVLGDFSGYRLGPSDNGYDFDAMVAYLRGRLPIPVLTGLPFGHIRTRCTLPFGAQGRLVSDAEGFTLTATGYPTLAALSGCANPVLPAQGGDNV
ncbi:muramoyltetrapeptide carboxypeptidase [Pseudoduganella ginsengisoli]|uniref:Muramoyltetrapeptide carboxypeptidase n=1 Tax=Pseudoduganella ginsengisoli TaxID=1462440 RepID=A0A6L6Q6G3_9BURK|nr:muramoyltetrapeptide carboxypeptidase [Pseudoduganella ginsengisoli]